MPGAPEPGLAEPTARLGSETHGKNDQDALRKGEWGRALVAGRSHDGTQDAEHRIFWLQLRYQDSPAAADAGSYCGRVTGMAWRQTRALRPSLGPCHAP